MGPEFARWFADRGDATRRLNYNIAQDDIVLDLGAYHGDWSKKIYDSFKCRVYAFEPVSSFHTLANKTLQNTRVSLFKFGVGPTTEDRDIHLSGDGTSLFHGGGPTERVRITAIEDVLSMLPEQQVALVKINIEGGEFGLLEHLIQTGLIGRFNDIQVQFHLFMENAVARREAIRQLLIKTHRVTYDYAFVWENWRLK